MVLTGANGSGKTSLLRILATFIAPVAGRLLWGSEPVAAGASAYRAQLDYVGHQDGLKPELTARETLAFWVALRGDEPNRARPLIETALTAFALDRVADWPCRWLSAGQRRRLALARLVAAPTPIWLLDEPTSALDDDNRLRLEEAISAHRGQGRRVVVASHLPLNIPGADTMLLDCFAPSADFAAAAG
jgi:heme exporter protein A